MDNPRFRVPMAANQRAGSQRPNLDGPRASYDSYAVHLLGAHLTTFTGVSIPAVAMHDARNNDVYAFQFSRSDSVFLCRNGSVQYTC